MKIKDFAFVRLKNDIWIKVDFNRIVYIKAGTNYSHMFDENGHRVTYRNPLIKLQNRLPLYFERIHSSYIININYISQIHIEERTVLLRNKMTLKIGSAYKDNIEKYFLDTAKRKLSRRI